MKLRWLGTTACLLSGLVFLPGWSCVGGGGTWDAPEDEGIPFDGPPGDAPTGQRFEEVEIEDGCGRTQLAFRLVDEVCGNATSDALGEGTALPESGDLAAPMFRDGAMVDGTLWAVDGTHLWVLDDSITASGSTTEGAPSRLSLIAGVGEALAIVAHGEGDAAGTLIAGGDAGLLEVTGTPDALLVATLGTFGGPALDVAVDGGSGVALVAAAEAGLVIDAASAGGGIHVDVGAPAVAVTTFGPHAFVATCDGLAVVDIASRTVVGQARGAAWVPGAVVDGVNHAPAKDVAVGRFADATGSSTRAIAFVAAGRYGAVAVDVTTPSAPEVAGNCTDVTNRAHYVSGVKVDQARGLLAIAAGERGVVVEADPAGACADGIRAPAVVDPVSLVDEDCEPKPPWDIVPNVSWEPPPPGKDPVQVLLVEQLSLFGEVEHTALAFGDARRNALRAVDAWRVPATGGTVNAGLTHVARAQEPRLLTGIAAGGPPGQRVLALGGARGGVFRLDDLDALFLQPDPRFAGVTVAGVPAVLDAGTVAVAALDVTSAGNVLRVFTPEAPAAPLEITLPGRVSPRALAVRGDGALITVREDAFSMVNPVDGNAELRPLARAAALAPAMVAVGDNDDDVVFAAPEWERAIVARTADELELEPELELTEHALFSVDEIMDLSLWRHGPPRHTLGRDRTDASRIVEVVAVADRAGLLIHERTADGFVVVTDGPVPPAPYVDVTLKSDANLAFLLAHDAARYRSELLTVDVGGAVPHVVGVQSWSGAAVGLTEIDGRLYVADADGEVRVYSASDGSLAGVVDVRGAP